MRITPVNNNFRKINFGMFDNKKTEELTRKKLEKEYDGYFDEDEIGGEEYNDAMKYMDDEMYYFKNSRLFTMRSKKDSEDEDVLYVTMNQKEVDKHEHKELFNKTIDDYKKGYDPSNLEKYNYTCNHIIQAQELNLLQEEGFLETLDDEDEIKDFYNEMQNNEHGIVPKEPEPRPTTDTSSDDDKSDPDSYEARFEKLRDFILYGSL